MFFAYLLLLILTLIVGIKNKNYKIPFFLIILLVLLTGFRKNGYDLTNYYVHFTEMNTIKDVFHTIFEPGYSFVAFLFKNLGMTTPIAFVLYMTFIASCTILLKYKTFNKLSPLPIISFLFYFLCFFIYNDYTQIRHGISIGICFYSLYFVTKDDFFKFFICWILAFSFHYSAILFLPIYFLKNIKISTKKFFIMILIIFIVSFVDIKDIILFINDTFINSEYISKKLNLYATGNLSFLNFSNLFKIIFIYVYIKFVYDKDNKIENVLVNTYLFGIFSFGLLSSYSIIAYRTNAFFRMTETILLTIYINKVSKLENKKIHTVFISIIILYYIFSFTKIAIDPNYFIYFKI